MSCQKTTTQKNLNQSSPSVEITNLKFYVNSPNGFAYHTYNLVLHNCQAQEYVEIINETTGDAGKTRTYATDTTYSEYAYSWTGFINYMSFHCNFKDSTTKVITQGPSFSIHD